MPLLKKEMRLISLSFVMFFLSKKCNWESLILMYVITPGCLFSSIDCFEKVIHEGWLGAPTIFSPSLDNRLEIV